MEYIVIKNYVDFDKNVFKTIKCSYNKQSYLNLN